MAKATCSGQPQNAQRLGSAPRASSASAVDTRPASTFCVNGVISLPNDTLGSSSAGTAFTASGVRANQKAARALCSGLVPRSAGAGRWPWATQRLARSSNSAALRGACTGPRLTSSSTAQ